MFVDEEDLIERRRGSSDAKTVDVAGRVHGVLAAQYETIRCTLVRHTAAMVKRLYTIANPNTNPIPNTNPNLIPNPTNPELQVRIPAAGPHFTICLTRLARSLVASLTYRPVLRVISRGCDIRLVV